MPVVKKLMKQICEKYNKQAKSGTEEFKFGKIKIFFKVGVLAEIEERRRVDEELQPRTKKLKPSRRNLLKKLQNEKREVAEKALSEMKIKNVDLETLKLEADNQRLQNDITEHKATIAKKDSVITELNKDIEDNEGEISDLKKKLEAEEDNSKDFETQLHVKEDDIADLEKQVKKLQNTISDVNAQNEDTGAVLNDTKDDIANTKNDLKKTQLALDDTEKKLDQQVAQNKKVSDERNGYNQKLKAGKTKTAALTSAKNASDKKISALNSEKDELEDKNRKFDSSNKDAQRKIAKLTKRIEDGLNDSDMLKAQKADYEAQIQALKDDMEKTEKYLAVAKSNMNQNDVEINNLNE
ncbi:myosin heavy chain, clone, putative [Entamoeba invadens IP1]|uniref:Myosin heavy chain, clone, putative n=1 Tax=Entamoeba invadens IP1 TaxID=370355 RepID=L7FJ56_ENTIV|nr:myosin heavy chain, clone, putative [Entamoeba invadens IP1]ELP83794.1 myosin heavy chain, clone, putative [Entamoeba invadens IP1]|eukprot:XP_004183140.1 myosin heavy chain, clone, putative [Entamoeba invadens IP1]